jgi:hypothetical protein
MKTAIQSEAETIYTVTLTKVLNNLVLRSLKVRDVRGHSTEIF